MTIAPLVVGNFPTAADIRKIPTRKQIRIDELANSMETWIKDNLEDMISDNQADGQDHCWFPFPDFVHGNEEETIFVNLMQATFHPLGYQIMEETDTAQEPTGNVVMSWKETKGIR